MKGIKHAFTTLVITRVMLPALLIGLAILLIMAFIRHPGIITAPAIILGGALAHKFRVDTSNSRTHPRRGSPQSGSSTPTISPTSEDEQPERERHKPRRRRR